MNSLRPLFAIAVFLGAFLLFLVEPMAAKQLLPALGGAASVWITCLVFFQTILLCGYLYAHWLGNRSQWQVHLLLLLVAGVAAFAWAFGSPKVAVGSGHPVSAVFANLGIWIGVPFIALASTSPLMQVWWARVQSSDIPYRLFALSNLASFLALGIYPSLMEPNLALKQQRISWACGFLAFAVIAGLLTWKSRHAPHIEDAAHASAAPEPPPAPLMHKLLWVLLPMGASMQLSAVTSYLTANVAAIPLLWVLPLGVYLLTLILAFQFPHRIPRWLVARLLVVLLACLGLMLAHTDTSLEITAGLAFYLVEIFISCLYCHSEAYNLRPKRAAESTKFYLLFAAGGALGSFLIGIAFPLIFRFNYDVAITFLVTSLLALLVVCSHPWAERILWSVASVMLAILVVWIHIASSREAVASVRNFYGTLRVRQDIGFPGATRRTLLNGTIQHGTQLFGTDALRRTPTTYYAEDSGIGLALRFCCHRRPKYVGVIGLGTGTIAAYGRPGDRIRFYDINPAVPPIAENVFSYLRDSSAQIQVIEGDGRLSLAGEPPQHFDVLVVDAFSGDAIPLHLLTTQAMAVYRRQLAPDGILVFHISNQHVDLGPPVALLAQASGMIAMRVSNPPNDERDEFASTWMLLCDNAEFFAQPEVAAHVHTPSVIPGMKVWTDDYSSLLPLVRW